ncbi:MAG: hypothetical protein KDB27_03630 [Planctomycetales bacterium]|nr:hypothetical protein [Planctomycetales bacterium]
MNDDVFLRSLALVCVAFCIGTSTWANELTVESFDGTGPFVDSTLRVDGLDLPNWTVLGSSELNGIGYPMSLQVDGPTSNVLRLDAVFWEAGFVQRGEIRDFSLFVSQGDSIGSATLSFAHEMPDFHNLVMRIGIVDPLGIIVGGSAISSGSPQRSAFFNLEVTENIALEFVYHKDLSLVEWRFDGNIDDSIPTVELGTNSFVEPELRGDRTIKIGGGISSSGKLTATIDHFYISPLVAGDFNYDLQVDSDDLLILAAAIQSGENDLRRDLTADQIVDSEDRDAWVHELASTYYGDTNLDGEFNSSDLVAVFNAAEYEDAVDGNSTWQSGDWNLDGDFTTNDLVLAFQDGGYEKGPRTKPSAVPEPATAFGTLFGFCALVVLRNGV